jgi:hypothetical protein
MGRYLSTGSVKHALLSPSRTMHEKLVLRDLAEFAYRLNHRFDLRAMIERLMFGKGPPCSRGRTFPFIQNTPQMQEGLWLRSAITRHIRNPGRGLECRQVRTLPSGYHTSAVGLF